MSFDFKKLVSLNFDKKPELISNKLPFERLAIGSAQFGFNYGIMNTVGQTTKPIFRKF